jgi:hypothetical protein
MKSTFEKAEAIIKKTNKQIKEKEGKIVYTSYVETEKSILEQLNHATHATHATVATETNFIIYDKLTASIDYLTEFEYHGTTYKPIVDDLLSTGVILLPSGIEEYTDTATLAGEIYDFLYENFEVPAFYQQFLPYIVMFSWVYEKFPFVPYLHFVGLTGTGKTTAAEAVTALCYKPIDAAGAITMSPIFRMASSWRGTLFLDEFEPGGDNYSEMIAFLKSGVGNRAVLRTEGDRKREVKAYLIKSMKIFTSEHPIPNAGLRSRMFVIEMEKSTRRIPLIKQQRFYDKAQILRNKLLLWRLRNFPQIDLTKIEYGYPEFSTFDRRVQQVLTPVYYLSDEASRKTILEFAKTQELETKRERAESIEGEVFQIISDMLPADPSLKQIADKLNIDRSRKPVTEKRIANVVRQILHFDIKRVGHDMVSTVLISEKPERVQDLSEYFGVELVPVAGVASVARVANGEMEPIDAPEDATHEQGEILDENGVPYENR